jgi:hypothetical protein
MRNLLPPLGVQLLVVVLHANRAHPHSITVVPMSRNAVDNRLPLWRDGAAPLSNGASGLAATGKDAGLGLCNETTEGLFSNSSAYCSGCFCSNGTSPCAAGQTCFWFSFSIGCPSCTGSNARAQKDTCSRGMRALICDPRLRTYNKGAVCNSAEDTYKHNPWRTP